MNKTLEELGYTKYENHPEDELGDWATQDNPYIRFMKMDGDTTRIITFDIWSKTVAFNFVMKIGGLNCTYAAPLTMEELNGVNLECRKMGWLND